ncbi:MAG: helix-turn-helix domain-containing protein [Cyanobacteria bacterium]|nr:helix-turn-helix domain-containing protein [Cyanobacteriota bacterium]
MSTDNLRDGRVKNWFYLENDLLDREDLTIYEKTVYIVIARYVNGENKAFPSYETIAKKGSMAKIQAMRVVKSLTQKGLLKKENRKNKDNKGSTSNLYTLLNPKPKNKDNNNKKEGVSDRYPGGNPQISGVVSPRYPNNTSIKNTSLNNVNETRDVLENPESKIIAESTIVKEDINDIKRKIKESLKEGEKYGLVESIKSVVNKYPELKRYKLKENELLAKEIAEVLEDNHSLGAFRTVVDKIPEQKIRIFLSIIKDTYLTGRIKKSRGAMFITLAKDYARKNNIDLNFK